MKLTRTRGVDGKARHHRRKNRGSTRGAHALVKLTRTRGVDGKAVHHRRKNRGCTRGAHNLMMLTRTRGVDGKAQYPGPGGSTGKPHNDQLVACSLNRTRGVDGIVTRCEASHDDV